MMRAARTMPPTAATISCQFEVIQFHIFIVYFSMSCLFASRIILSR
jgi:hypothetical protein